MCYQTDTSAAGGPTVLIVEDDFSIRESLSEMLREEGYTVETAEHGRQALERLHAGVQPAIILLDLMMPVMDGWQVLEALEAHPTLSRVPVIVVSAAVGNVPAHARGFLRKPIRFAKLLEAINGQLSDAPGGARP
ncbi:MAG TPA: response regulator [Myxococcota bacterium]|nr:response regulator [Myxococcota bacterium]